MLRLRLLTTAVGLPLVLLALFLGPHPFGIFLTIVAAICTIEFCRIAPGLPARDPLVVLATLWAVLLATRHVLFPGETTQSLIITVPLVVSLVLLLARAGKTPAFLQWSWAVAGALYVGWLLGHWGGLYMLPGGGHILVLFGLLTMFAYDTFAFFSGRAFGRHKLAPRISGAKTWEGAIGGLVAASCIGLLIRAAVMTLERGFPFSLATTLVATVCIVIGGQLGDLVESALKRSANVKDTGGILPGHGGMLDRFDSLLFAGPVLYYFTLWVTT